MICLFTEQIFNEFDLFMDLSSFNEFLILFVTRQVDKEPKSFHIKLGLCMSDDKKVNVKITNLLLAFD